MAIILILMGFSVEERLPEDTRECLVQDSAGVFTAYYENNQWHGPVGIERDITHWVPVPKRLDKGE